MKKEEAHFYFETERWAVRKHAPIRPAKEFIPQSWANMPVHTKKAQHGIDSEKTVKACPGIGDYMATGYILPAWCDIEIFPGEEHPEVRYSDPTYNHAWHPADQLNDSILPQYKVRCAVKLDNPWKMYAAPGWSLLYQPMWYFEDRNYDAIPGIIDHDLGAVMSPINIMLKEAVPTTIKMGEPICQMIPIKREKIIARTGDMRKSTVDRHNAIIGLKNLIFAGWTRWQHQKKDYVVDAHDTILPGDTD